MENYGAYWNIKINDIGFPDVLLSNSQEKTMGAEIITSRNPQVISVRFHDIFSRAYFEATEKGLNIFLLIIAYSGEAVMATIERTVDQIKEDTIQQKWNLK
jgi:hypothetical protein